MNATGRQKTVASQLRVGYPTHAGTAKTEILVHEYFEREVRPHVPDAWINEGKTKVGYEIPFTRHFYEYVPRGVRWREIEADIAEQQQKLWRTRSVSA